ncbi:hypothetical protein NBRC116583_34760 [Arenicella sp. 4NH20-0111]
MESEGIDIWLKDERTRFGLGSFKSLGSAYAVIRHIADSLQICPSLVNTDIFRHAATHMTFVCASAGNHGLGVAAASATFGAKARIHLASTVPESYSLRLQKLGATVLRSGANYEESMELAITDTESTGAILLADSSWNGYSDVPKLIMEGYTVIAEELRTQFESEGTWPTHVYLQAGVGSFAAALTTGIRENWQVQPHISIVEPVDAACLLTSASVGAISSVSGAASIMGMLDCKVPSQVAFEVLKNEANNFISISDAEARRAVEKLQRLGVATTPSGGAGFAAVLKEQKLLDAGRTDFNPLIIVTEADHHTSKSCV